MVVTLKKNSLKYLLTLSKNNQNELMYLLKSNNFLLNSRKQEIKMEQIAQIKQTTFFGQKSVLDISNEPRSPYTYDAPAEKD